MELDEAFVVAGETGSGGNWPTVWGPPYNDLVAQIDYTEDKELPAAIAKTGHSTKDVKAAILGHLHLDHAGGPEHFVGTDIPSMSMRRN
ncbi:hypothetical protein ACEPPN_018510 [Leptodophora sp. 'Broadleaf-Isolate-01']